MLCQMSSSSKIWSVKPKLVASIHGQIERTLMKEYTDVSLRVLPALTTMCVLSLMFNLMLEERKVLSDCTL